MANYLISHYKGIYRIRTEYDLRTNQFPRKPDDTFEDLDCYIDCMNKIQIFHYGHGILEAYIPSKGRGHNIVKAIKEDIEEDIIFGLYETDSEVIFKFNSKHMDKLEKYLKPKTAGANISPFSTKNLPKAKYNIPDEDLVKYKNIVQKIGQNRVIELTHKTNGFLKGLSTKKNPWEKIKADMALKCLKGKEYIHSIGKWEEFITYLEKEF